MGGGPAGSPPSASSRCRWVAVSRDGTVLSRTPLTSRCTTVASAQNVTAVPARSGPSQNCWPQTHRFPDAGTTRVNSTARLTGSTPLRDSTGGAGIAGPDVDWGLDLVDTTSAGSGSDLTADRAVGRRSGNRSSAARGENRSVGNAMPRDWCGRLVLYSARNASTA